MKQNERLLVYAVTGFLALILVIAVLFGNDPVNAANKQEKMSKGLNEILQTKDPVGQVGTDKTGDNKTGDNKTASDPAGQAAPREVEQQPLIAKPVLASAVVERAFGVSRRDRFVRFVRVKRGDAFETLVRRWCGSTDGFLEEAYGLNENLRDMKVLRAGAEVAVPWVDDEVLVAILEAQGPRTMVSTNSFGPEAAPENTPAGVPTPTNGGLRTPSFGVPGTGPGVGDAKVAAVGSAAASAVTYKVKPNDSLWRIAAKRCAKNQVPRVVREIEALNPGLPDPLPVGYELKLPAKAN
jgi:phage tail protein X